MTEVPAHLLARAQAAKAKATARATGQEVPVPRATPEAIGRMNMKTLSAEGQKSIERKLKRTVRKHLVKEWLITKPINKYWVLLSIGIVLWVGMTWVNVFVEMDGKLIGAISATAGVPTLAGIIGTLYHGVDW